MLEELSPQIGDDSVTEAHVVVPPTIDDDRMNDPGQWRQPRQRRKPLLSVRQCTLKCAATRQIYDRPDYPGIHERKQKARRSEQHRQAGKLCVRPEITQQPQQRLNAWCSPNL